jgi:hypothetical protein
MANIHRFPRKFCCQKFFVSMHYFEGPGGRELPVMRNFPMPPTPAFFHVPIDWMPWIERQAIHPHGSIVAAPLHILLPGIVAIVAQALQPPEPELIRVVVVRLDMVGTSGGDRTPAFAQAHFAQRRNAELVLGYPSPTAGSVQAHQTFFRTTAKISRVVGPRTRRGFRPSPWS